MTKRRQRGSAMIEMTFVGIPLIFILISVFEVSRGMWMYHTLAYSVKEGVRFAIVHGKSCGTVGGVVNTCLKTQLNVAQVIQDAGVGLDLDNTKLRFCAGVTGTACTSQDWTCTLGPASGTPCAGSTWPPSGSDGVGGPIEIDITTPFRSATAMFWPGGGNAMIGVANFVANSTDRIQF